MKKRIADIVVETLIENGITDCFSVVGGGAMHLNNAFVLAKKQIRTIYNHHEQACAMAAEGYARLCGKMAAVCVTSGPGGTNAINGVQGAWVDSIPMIVISGHPRYATTVAETGLRLRARGVQENDIIAQVKSITKYAKLVKEPKRVKAEIQKAIYLAGSGRRGPVWIDIPLDVQGMLIEEDELEKCSLEPETEIVSEEQMNCLQEMLLQAERPCLLTGSGIRSGNAEKEYREFLKDVNIPIVGGALQADINYNGEKNYYGMSGSVGPRCGNFILQSADVILVLGNSLAFKQTGFNQDEFAKHAKIIMVDAEEDEAKKPGLHVDLAICADLKKFFKTCLQKGIKVDAPSQWFEHCNYVSSQLPRYEMLERHGKFEEDERVPLYIFWREFLKVAEEDAVIALGNSGCGLGILQEGITYKEQRVLVNYNCGSMGDDLPEALGAATAGAKTVYCVTGDGSVMMNLQELQTIHYYGFPVKVIIFSNDGYGAIRNTCSNFFHGTYTGCDEESGVSFPDFSKVAEAFQMKFHRCHCISELNESLEWLKQNETACILEICERIDEIKGPRIESKMDENGVFSTPALHDMSPFFSEEEISKYLIMPQ